MYLRIQWNTDYWYKILEAFQGACILEYAIKLDRSWINYKSYVPYQRFYFFAWMYSLLHI